MDNLLFARKKRIYKRAGLRWQVHATAGGRNTLFRQYIKSTISTSSLPAFGELRRFTISKKFIMRCRKLCLLGTIWLRCRPTINNPTIGPFASLQDAFVFSVDSSRILLNHYVLPPDNCQLIAATISNGIAITVYDGFYNPRDRLGTVVFVMGQKERQITTNSS